MGEETIPFFPDLDNFLALENANIFVFSSLNRNFALSLNFVEDRLHLNNKNKKMLFCFVLSSICTIFALINYKQG